MRLTPIFTTIALALSAWSGQVTAAPELRIGIGLTKPPYIMEGGETGLEYDIVDEALQAGGYKMVAISLPPARALALMQVGQLEGMTTITEGIGGKGYFSNDYIAYQNVAITLKQRNIKLSRIADLSRYSIAAFQNATLILSPEYAAAVAGHTDYREYPQQLTQNKLLYAGRVDIVIGDRLVFHHLTQHISRGVDTSQPITIHPLFPPTPRKAVFRDEKVRNAFNAGLKKIHQNGTYSSILAKYRPYFEH